MARPRYIDLHLHTTASDGRCRPGDLVRLAAERRLSAVSITDHDTVGGLAEAAEAASRVGVELVPGIELGTSHARGTLHILGYFIQAESAALRRSLEEVRAWRQERNQAIVRRLAELGIMISSDWTGCFPAEQTVGRPHLAAELVRLGVVHGIQQAFAQLLGRGAAAYVKRQTWSPEQAIRIIRDAGGVAALAHPALLEYGSRLELATLLHRLRAAGLQAIEVHHPAHATVQSRLYVELAAKMGLAMTGGSDLHDLRGGCDRGVGFCGVRVPHLFLDALRRLVQP